MLGRGSFLQDFWLYGSRRVMDVALTKLLDDLLDYGRSSLLVMHDPKRCRAPGRPKGCQGAAQCPSTIIIQFHTRCPGI